jgi:hypothetical protein
VRPSLAIDGLQVDTKLVTRSINNRMNQACVANEAAFSQSSDIIMWALVLREQNDQVHPKVVQLYPLQAGMQGHGNTNLGVDAIAMLS